MRHIPRTILIVLALILALPIAVAGAAPSADLPGGPYSTAFRVQNLSASANANCSYTLYTDAGATGFSASLPAIAAVCTDGDDDAALERIEALVEASLVIVEQGPVETRYGLLETVRQYAAQRLAEAGGRDALRNRHAAWFLTLAETAAPELAGEAQGGWFTRLEVEQDNLRTALA